MSGLVRKFRSAIVFCFMAALFIEAISFTVVSLTNVILYGHIREGSRAVYDPYTLFLQTVAERRTVGNAPILEGHDTKTIWMFGGSTMRGSTDDDSQTIPSLTAKILNQAGGEHHYVIRNFGINSFNSLMESKYLQKVLMENTQAPDLIVFYDGANDAKYFVEFRTADAHHGYTKVKGVIESYYGSWFGFLKPVHAALYASFTYELWGRINQTILPLDVNDPELDRMIMLTLRRYDAIDRMAKGLQSRFLLAWQPMLWTQECSISESLGKTQAASLMALKQMAYNFRAVYEPLRYQLSVRAFFYDLSSSLCGKEGNAYKEDGVHLTDDGRQIIAERLADRINRLF